MTARPMVLLGAFLLLCACETVGPEFRKPTIPLAQRFAYAPHDPMAQAAQDSWWDALRDPVLVNLMARALSDNLSLARATTRIRAARALLGTTGLPAQVSGDAVVKTTQSWVEGYDWRRSDTLEIQPSFVFDLFGRRKRATEVALADVAVAKFDAAAGRLALQLEVVSTYLDLRAEQEREIELERTVRNRRQLVSATRARVEAQQSILLDLRIAEAELVTAESRLPDARTAQKLAILRMATLLATPANTLMPLLDQPRTLPAPPRDFDPGVPAALLRNRPDVRSAEAGLASAVAEVGLNEADLYPALQIGGTIRLDTTSQVSLGPALSIPLLDRPLRKARLEAARARAGESHVVWRQTVLDAVEEVQAALVRLEEQDREIVLLDLAASKLRSVEDLARQSFRLGETTLTDVLDTEQRSTAVRLDQISARLAYARAWAQLNTAIGQGWDRAEILDTAQHRGR